MGVISSQLSYYSTRTDDADAVTGLTSREKYLLRTSWAPVKKDLVGGGVTLLLMLFDKYPEDKQYFPFREVQRDKLKDDKKFQAHCSSVMHAFNSLVESLDDGELLLQILQKQGENHRRHKVTKTSFLHLRETLLELFGTFMSKEAMRAWEKTLDLVINVMEKYL